MSGDGDGSHGGGQGGARSGPVGDGDDGNDLGIPGLTALERIASGGSSIVYRAEDVRHARTVAVKVLNAGRVSAEDELALDRELAAMGRLSTHPNIIDLYDSGTTVDRHPFIVTPYYGRGNYADNVDENGPMAWQELVDFAIKIAAALHTAHTRGFVHRDIKPANIFLGEFDRQPILADFGIASFASPGLAGSMTVKVSTTPLYGAPEVLEGERPTERSDIYSFGATLFALVEGAPAFADPSTEVVVYRVTAARVAPRPTVAMPSALSDLIAQMMARDPDQRPATCLEIARRLVALQKEHGLDPTPIVTDEVDDTTGRPEVATVAPAERPPAADHQSAVPRSAPVEPAESIDSRPGEAGLVEPKPVIEPLPGVVGPVAGPGNRGRSGATTRPVGSLDRPTEPAIEDPKTVYPRRSRRPSTRPALRWAVGAAAALTAAALAYSVFGPSSPKPGEIIEPEADAGRAALLSAWEAAAGPVSTWDAHPSAWTTVVEFGPGGDSLASAGTDGRVKTWLWFDQPGSPAATGGYGDWVVDVTWSPDGGFLAAAVADGTLAISPADGQGPTISRQGPNPQEAVVWSPDGQRLLAGDDNGGLLIHDNQSAGEGSLPLPGHDAAILDVDWQVDDRALSSGKDGRVIIWNVDSATPIAVIDHPDGAWTRSVEWVAPTLFLTTDEDGTVTLWSLMASTTVPEQLSSIEIGPEVLATDLFVDQAVMLAAGYEDGSVRVWDLATGREVVKLSASGDADDATSVSWTPDGRALAVGRLDGSAQIWAID